MGATERKPLPTYDPCERRLRSVKGGTDRIPMPYWMHSHFNIYGKPEGTQRRSLLRGMDVGIAI